jgi:predicted dehydrogenase/threonine dehydrogenase-like Zn-dependent dehydrogenase
LKQVLQSLRNGETSIVEVPCPAVRPGHLLIRTSRTLISAGTERSLVEFGKAGWIEKARQQPDKVKQVWAKIRADGLAPTIEAVLNKLEQPLPLGYCNVGTVIEVGAGVNGFIVGDRVASNGRHAEVVCVPTNLCARVPATVSDEDAAFTVLSSIALQGIRLANPTLGETVAVSGLGLIGLVTVQLLRASGCRVIGMDFDRAKLELARSFGAETVDLAAGTDPVQAAMAYTGGRGIDAVLITAATSSSEPVRQAAHMSRKRGRIVLVGVAGLELSRADFYEKELTFQVSCSYGPGRYEPDYEERGFDYPLGFVRWTEQRNFEAVLESMSLGALRVTPLVSHRFAISEAEAAYARISGPEPSLGVLLEYQTAGEEVRVRSRTIEVNPARGTPASCKIGFIGSGNYASAVLIPAFREAGAGLRVVASSAGVTGLIAAKRFGFEAATTDTTGILADNALNAVVIATRHDNHAELLCRALRAGKHVFVEKPIALKAEEIDDIEAAYHDAGTRGTAPIVMVGFNRRFAPQVMQIHKLMQSVTGPSAMVMTVNSGSLPADHWTQEPNVGGGRLVGEGCHFIDLLRHLAGSPISDMQVATMDARRPDTFSLSMSFENGSIGTVHYFANGSKSFPKERLEVFCGERILQLDNYRRLRAFGWPGFSSMRLWRQDKGQRACAAAFVKAIETGDRSPIPFTELVEVGRATLRAAELQVGQRQ